MRIEIINGPNLNLTGRRQPNLYGKVSFEEYIPQLQEKYAQQGVDIIYRQSNHEGQIIDWLQNAEYHSNGVVLNAGAYSHTSIAIADTIEAIHIPVVEVHISNILQREPFRHHSYLTEVCAHTIIGEGLKGYEYAIDYLIETMTIPF